MTRSNQQARRLERRQIAALMPNARNARTHSAHQIAQLAASIREFGFTNPVLVSSEGDIIAGHGRVLAAEKLGLEEVPVLVLDYLTPTQRRAYALADNQLAVLSGWDDELLALELRELNGAGFDASLTGFSERDQEALFQGIDASIEAATDAATIVEQFRVLVTCSGEREQVELLNQLQKEGYECRALIS